MKKTVLSFCLLFALNGFSQIIDVTEIELNFNGDSYPQNFTKGITKIYFSADDGINMEELWVYDTITNTTHLVKDVGSGNSGLDNSILMTIGDILYFTINNGSQLWRSDGTEAGTYLVKLVSTTPASNNTITALFDYNGNVVFDAYDPINGKELWISDGTTAGTTLLKDIRPGAVGSNPNSFFVCNGILYFTANDGINGNEIWKSDGTPSGTVIFKNIDGTSSSSITSGFIVLNNNFYFYCYTSANGYELWKSDGTDSGTQLFKDIIPGTDSSNYYLYGTATPNYFIFAVESPTIGRELWICDGTVAGTTLLKDINPSGNGIPDTAQFAWFNNKIYFNAYTTAYGEELWATDGTTSGTQLVKDIQPGSVSSYITKLTSTSNFLIFSAQVSAHTYTTPWRSDGTNAGTFELKDTNLSTTSAGNLSFEGFNNMAFFGSGYNSSNGNELWSTDGTTENTTIFKDIFHRYSGIYNLNDVAEINNKIIYTSMTGYKPAQSNGTINGTSILNNISAGSSVIPSYNLSAFYTKAGNYVFFKALTSANGYELWKTDGTAANTSMVKDIRTGTSSSLTNDLLFISYNNIFYFKANDGTHGEELWRSDGTDAGTYILKDINVGSSSSLDAQSNVYHDDTVSLNENNFGILNGFLYFSAYDGTDSSIWRTDGTESGTVKVIIITSAGSSDNRRRVINATNNKIFFKSNSDNSSYGNHSLWSSDGTQAGTTFLGLWSNTATQFKKNIIHNNELYFTVNANTTGRTLMKSDGTVSGTVVVKDNFTTYNSFTTLYSCGNYVYFTVGQQSLYAEELWRTDGTTTGTVKLGDLTAVGSDIFIGCNVCHQNNLLYLKNSSDDKIWYVNGTSTDINSYLSTNVTDAAPFAVRSAYGITGLYQSNIGLFFTGSSAMGGAELYHTDFDITLDTPDFSSDNNVKDGIVLYPNPTKNMINIKINNGEEVTKVKVFNLLGKQVYSSNSNAEHDLSHLTHGIYLVKVSTDKSDYNSKLVIRK